MLGWWEGDGMQHHELCDYHEAELKGEHHVECGGASALVATLLVHHCGLRKRGAGELLYLAGRVVERQIADSGGVRHRPCAAAEASQRREPPVHAQNVTEIQWRKAGSTYSRQPLSLSSSRHFRQRQKAVPWATAHTTKDTSCRRAKA